MSRPQKSAPRVVDAANFLAQSAHAEEWLRQELARLKEQGYEEVCPGVYEKRDEAGRLVAVVGI